MRESKVVVSEEAAEAGARIGFVFSAVGNGMLPRGARSTRKDLGEFVPPRINDVGAISFVGHPRRVQHENVAEKSRSPDRGKERRGRRVLKLHVIFSEQQRPARAGAVGHVLGDPQFDAVVVGRVSTGGKDPMRGGAAGAGRETGLLYSN